MPQTRATRRRVDHVPLYMSVVTAQAVIAIIILSQAVYTTLYYWMSLAVETLAASALLLSAIGCWFGIASGTRRFRPHADIRDSYILEAWSLVLMAISMAVFFVGILRGGGHTGDVQMVLVLMGFVIVGLAFKAWDFHVEVQRLSRDLIERVEGRSRDGD